MKIKKYIAIVLGTVLTVLNVGCNQSKPESTEAAPHEHHDAHSSQAAVHLSAAQFKAMQLKVDTLPWRNVSATVSSNGRLQVPPQHEAAVTAIVGANISEIMVLEGDSVSRGQVLARLQHPDLITIQSNYVEHWNNLQFMEQEIERQQRLYDEEVSAGKQFQQTQSEYQALKGKVSGLEAQFELLGLNPEPIRNGEIASSVPVRSPIDGFVRKVLVKTGQYVQPQTELFDIVNVEHLHADFMVFEKDMHKVQVGQTVRFTTEAGPMEEMTAEIYAVGKAFEQNPKAMHLHAHIEEKSGLLLPGMYIRGEILLQDSTQQALPEGAVVRDGGKHYIFTAEKHQHGETEEWAFQPLEVIPLHTDKGWTALEPMKEIKELVLWNNAYYLMAEMQKGEGGGEHRH